MIRLLIDTGTMGNEQEDLALLLQETMEELRFLRAECRVAQAVQGLNGASKGLSHISSMR